jgi:hypothetical protein
VTVGGQAFAVDCPDAGDPAVLCDADSVTIQLPDGVGGGEVTWSLSIEGTDTAMGGGDYVGSGTFTPEWTSSTPNGPDCGSTCWSGEGTVELSGTP